MAIQDGIAWAASAGLCLAGMLCVGNFDVAEFERVVVKEKMCPRINLVNAGLGGQV